MLMRWHLVLPGLCEWRGKEEEERRQHWKPALHSYPSISGFSLRSRKLWFIQSALQVCAFALLLPSFQVLHIKPNVLSLLLGFNVLAIRTVLLLCWINSVRPQPRYQFNGFDRTRVWTASIINHYCLCVFVKRFTPTSLWPIAIPIYTPQNTLMNQMLQVVRDWQLTRCI